MGCQVSTSITRERSHSQKVGWSKTTMLLVHQTYPKPFTLNCIYFLSLETFLPLKFYNYFLRENFSYVLRGEKSSNSENLWTISNKGNSQEKICKSDPDNKKNASMDVQGNFTCFTDSFLSWLIYCC